MYVPACMWSVYPLLVSGKSMLSARPQRSGGRAGLGDRMQTKIPLQEPKVCVLTLQDWN